MTKAFYRLAALFLVSLFTGEALSQADSLTYFNEIQAYQQEMNAELKDPKISPLPNDELADFQGVEFFPVNDSFNLAATLILTPDAKPFEMTTTSERAPKYRKYGLAVFKIGEFTDTVELYENLSLMGQKAYEDYLFMPFSDNTNGFQTYGGGRYLDLRIPKGDTIIIDFNRAYNPYCVYNYKYSCPIPPRENYINFNIRAGVMNYSNL